MKNIILLKNYLSENRVDFYYKNDRRALIVFSA